MGDYKDPKKLAWALQTSENYSEAAEKLGCSTGSISVWKAKLSDELKEYEDVDFSAERVDPDKVENVQDRVLSLLEQFDVETSQNTIKVGEIGLIIDTSGSISDVKGKDLNPMVAISEHRYSKDWVKKCEESGVGLLIVSEDEVEVLVDADVTEYSGVRAILNPETSETNDKYLSRAWMSQFSGSIQELCLECSILPRTAQQKMRDMGLELS